MKSLTRKVAALVAPVMVGAALVGVSAAGPAVADTVLCTHTAGHGVAELQGCVDPGLIEAEDADLSAGLVRGDAHTGYSGTSFIGTMYDVGASITFDLYHPGAPTGTGTVRIRYANGSSARTLSLYADDAKVQQVSFPKVSDSWDSWGWVDVAGVPMTGDVTTMSLRMDSDDTGSVNIDAFSYVSGVIRFAPVPLATSWAGVPFSQKIGVVGGSAPYTFTVASGALPVGLTLSSAGLLSGTPTSTAPSTLTIRATDSDAIVGDRVITFQVSAIAVITASAPPRTTAPVTITGAGFSPNEAVTLSWSPAGAATSTATASGSGVLSATLVAPAASGTYDVVAAGPTSEAHVTVVVLKRDSQTTLAADRLTAAVGQPVVLSASVAPAGSGTVEFFDGSTSVGTANVVDGVATLSTSDLPRGLHALSANYSGDAGISGSSSGSTTVSVIKRDSVVLLSADRLSVTVGDSVTLTAVLQGEGTGTVEFFDGERSLGSAAVLDESATISVSSLSAGVHQIGAVYSGDSQSKAGSASGVTVTVSKGVVSLSRPVVSASSVTYGAATAVTVSTAVAGATSGTVVFRAGSTVLGSATVQPASSGYRATLTLPRTLAVGHYQVVASVTATSSLAAAMSSASATLSVKKTGTRSLSVTAKKYVRGKSFKAIVKVGALTNGAAATGKVKVYVGSKLAATATASSKVTVKLSKKYAKAKKVTLKVVFVPTSSATTEQSRAKYVAKSQ